jgi:hypothetical protein
VALALLALVAALISPIQRSSGSISRRRPEGFRRNFALHAPDSSRLSVTTWAMREASALTVRSEADEDEDRSGMAQQVHETHNPSLSTSRGAPARNPAVSGCLPSLHPLRC